MARSLDSGVKLSSTRSLNWSTGLPFSSTTTPTMSNAAAAREVAAGRAHVQAGAGGDADLDLVELAVPRRFPRLEAEAVVHGAVVEDALQRRLELVAVEEGQAPGVQGE